MTEQALQQYLIKQYPKEDEGCEWKEFKNLKNDFSGHEKDDVISYVSALANMEGGHLVVGVEDNTLNIVGTDTYNYTTQQATLRLTNLCANLSSEGLDIEEFITEDTHKKVWVIHIPKHLPKLPVYAHNKAWQRIEDSLVELTPERLNAILEEQLFAPDDWSAGIVENATLADLDELAVAKARVMYKKVHSKIPASEIDGWSVEELLSNSGIMIDGKLTRAAIILLGKPTAVFKLRPAVVEVTWTLRDAKEDVVDYEHFTAPFILTVDEILGKIRNLTMRELQGGTLFPDTMKQYDNYSIREALHNAIAHQDYTLQERINFVENPGYVYYENGGSFIPGTLQKALAIRGPQRHFRNECLCKAMVHFNMIDTVSRGIKKIFDEQWRRHFPMPDYEIDAVNKVVGVRLYGNAINEKYTKILKENKTLTLHECIALDAVQKGHQINEETAEELLDKGLIEGESPNYQISLGVAKITHQLPEYTRVSGLERSKLKQMTLQFIQNAGEDGTMRDGIYEYLKVAMPSNKTKEQNLRLLGNILKELKEEGAVSLKGLSWYEVQNPTKKN